MKPDCSEQRSEWGVESKNNEDRLGFSICRQSVNNYSFVPFFQSLHLLFSFLLSTVLVRAFRTMLNSSRGGRNPCSSLVFKRNLMIPCWERYLVHTIYQVSEVPFHSYIVEFFFLSWKGVELIKCSFTKRIMTFSFYWSRWQIIFLDSFYW